jgi:hypothetical protein
MSGFQNAINVVKAIGGASILLSIRSGSEKYYARKNSQLILVLRTIELTSKAAASNSLADLLEVL